MTCNKRIILLGVIVVFGASAASRGDTQVTNQPASSATLAETVEWIKSKIDGERVDAVGVRVRTTLRVDQCRAFFRKDGGALILATGVFDLRDIAYLEVIDRPVGTRWTGTFMVFKTGGGRAQINRGDLSGPEAKLVERLSPSFDWHLGSVAAGTSTADLRELGGRLRNAFVHAVQLCGGTVKREIF